MAVDVNSPLWDRISAWIGDKKAHTCSCGHVAWAHWPNGRCAHCNCPGYDKQPRPS